MERFRALAILFKSLALYELSVLIFESKPVILICVELTCNLVGPASPSKAKIAFLKASRDWI